MSAEKKQKVAIFDLDGTLINGDSTIEFVEYFLRHQKNKTIYIKFLLGRFLNSYGLLSVMGKDWRHYVISLLKGASRNNMLTIAKIFATEYLSKITNTNILDKAKELQCNGYKIIIISGSIDMVVSAFAEFNHFLQGVGSSLVFNDNGTCKGTFEEDILLHKVDYIDSRSDTIDLNNSYIFSDNQPDINILKKFGHRFGVIGSYAEGYYWRKNQIETFYKIPKIRINPFILYLPFSYYRYRTTGRYFWLSIMDYIISPLLVILTFNQMSIAKSISLFGVACLAFYSIYEIGYIANDIHAFSEKFPTYRIDKTILVNKTKLVAIRLIYAILAIIILIVLKYQWLIFGLGLISLGVIYFLHNCIQKDNIAKTFTLSALRISKFIIPILPFFTPNKMSLAMISVFLWSMLGLVILFASNNKKMQPTEYQQMSIITTDGISVCAIVFSSFYYYQKMNVGLINKNYLYLIFVILLAIHPVGSILKYLLKSIQNKLKSI